MTISDRDFAYLHKVSGTIEGFDPKPAASMGVTRVHLHGGEELFWRSKALQIKFRDPDVSQARGLGVGAMPLE
jgi:hypothetical protein